MNLKIKLLLAAALIFCLQVFGSGTERRPRPAPQFHFNQDHALLGQILSNVVREDHPNGGINLETLKKNAPLLKKYIGGIQTVVRTEFYEFSKEQKHAFLLNAYNAFFLNYLMTSEGAVSVFEFPENEKIEIFHDEMSAKEFLRDWAYRKIDDPKYLIGFLCLKRNCPEPIGEAFVSDKIDLQIRTVLVGYLRDKSKNFYNPATKELVLADLFKKYETPIVRKYRFMGAFVAPYMDLDLNTRRRSQIGLVKVKYRN